MPVQKVRFSNKFTAYFCEKCFLQFPGTSGLFKNVSLHLDIWSKYQLIQIFCKWLKSLK